MALNLAMSVVLSLATTAPLHAQASQAAPATAAPPSTASQAVDSAGRVVTQPLRDLNLVREGISPEIEKIMAAPYDLTGLRGCADYRAEIERLTAVLGPDVDSAEARASAMSSTEFVMGAAESAAISLIPGRGLVRRLSGADAERQRAQAAILAGQLRRAFIKGRASGRNCRL
jgi:hypothetical protein